MITRRRSINKHSQKQKEVVRKRGSSYLRKGVHLGQKANIIAGGFYQEPTHGRWCVSYYLPEGCKVPDLQAIFHDEVKVQQLPCDRQSGKRGATIITSGALISRRNQNIVDSFAELSFRNKEVSPNSTPSIAGNDLDNEGQQSVNECQISDTSDWDIVQEHRNIDGDGINDSNHLTKGNINNQHSRKDENIAQIGPQSPTCVPALANDCRDTGFSIHEQDLVNWEGLGAHVPSEISIHSRGQHGDISITCKLTGSLHVENGPFGVNKDNQKLHMLAAAASAEAAKQRVAGLLQQLW